MKQLQGTIRERMPADGPDWARFLLSMPERLVRSAAALAAGMAKEIGRKVKKR